MARTLFALAALALFLPLQSIAAPTGRCSHFSRGPRPSIGSPSAVPSASQVLIPVEPTPEPTPTTVEQPATPTATPPSANSPTPSTPSVPVENGSGLTAVQKEYLDVHNNFRARFNAQALSWSAKLEASAQAVANKCSWNHSKSGVGENFAAGTGNVTPTSAIQLWLNEEKDYNPANPVYSHFTQVVWKGTTELGCATAKCTSGLPIGSPSSPATFTVCHYNPAGNVIGQFDQNVEIPN